MRIIRAVSFILAMGLSAGVCRAAEPTTRPTTAPSDSPASEVQEWLILVSDPNTPQASSGPMYGSSLPEFANPRRPSASGEKMLDPCPVGVIRLFADKPDSADKLDVMLTIKGGRFMGNWPKATSRTTGLLWQDWQLRTTPDSLETLNPKHWFNLLRKGESAYLVKNNRSERFIAYDLEIAYANPVQVRANGPAYLAWNTGSVPLHDVCIYKSRDDGWHTTTLARLDPSAPVQSATAPATRPTTAPSTLPTSPVAGGPATQPTTQPVASGPTTRNVAEPTLGAAGIKDAAELLAPWKAKLSAAGLSSTDFDVILSILTKYGLDSKRMTIVYRLDPSEMERLLPIEVVPQPRKVTRVGLVIVRNIDPAIGQEIEQLIVQLGDPDWPKREAAHKQLSDLGLPAKAMLEQASKNNKDLEVVWRSERLLAKINKDAAK
ncbi:MAG: hypothetical protein ACHRHE_15115 [Tepidisphaerales bacterium]